MIEQYLKGLKVPKDELTAIERNKLLNEGKDVDRIMCCIDSGETLAPLIGCTLPEYYFSAEKMCELEEYIYNKFHSDGAGLSTTLRGMAEAMGSKIKYSDYNIAQLETPAISSLDEVDKLKLINVDEDGRLPFKRSENGQRKTWRQSPCERDCHWTIYRCLNACWNRKSSERYGKTTG